MKRDSINFERFSLSLSSIWLHVLDRRTKKKEKRKKRKREENFVSNERALSPFAGAFRGNFKGNPALSRRASLLRLFPARIRGNINRRTFYFLCLASTRLHRPPVPVLQLRMNGYAPFLFLSFFLCYFGVLPELLSLLATSHARIDRVSRAKEDQDED